MVQGYYTLDEAARILGVPPEELNQMAQRHEVRGFTDRGTWRFRTQDIEELARRRGLGSNPDLPLGEAPRPKPQDSPAPKSGSSSSDPDVFHFALGDESDQVEIGQEIISESASGRKTGSKASRPSGSKSPNPRSSDSDVRLVSDGSDVGLVSDSKVQGDPATRPSSRRRTGPKQDSGVRLIMDQGPDSDVQIVPDSDKEMQLLGGAPKTKSDSDIRLEPGSGVRQAGRGADDSFMTEEIDLDAELRKAEEAARPRKPQPKAKTPLPKTSPFELSDADVNLAPQAPPEGQKTPARKTPTPQGTPQDSSSEFDLSIAPEDLSPLEVSSGEMAPLRQRGDEDVSLGDMPAKVTGSSSDSGINLQEPADSGISLEQGPDSGSDVEFELSLDAESTPQPAKAEPKVDSSSEFELTLEDSARLAPLEEEAPKEAAKGDKDIFETDFDVPPLEDSGSQVAALEESDTDLESSDFDLALGEEDVAAEEESGSQVVALEDEEEVDEGAATVARPRAAAEGEEEVGEVLGEEELEAGEEPVVRPAVAAAAAPADWGVFTPVMLAVSTVVLFFVAVMSYELVHSMWSYHQPGKAGNVVVRAIAGLLYDQKQLPSD